MTDYAALKAEILLPAYNGMTDAQIAAAVNAKMITVKRNIDSQDAINGLIFTSNGDWSKVAAIATGIINDTQANRLNALGVMEIFIRNAVFDTEDDTRWTRFISAVDLLIAQARMSSEGKSLLVAMGRPIVNFAASIGWPGGVGDGDVAAARVWV